MAQVDAMLGRAAVLLAGLAGALGVALAAAAAHGGGGPYASQTSTILLFHAPALLALGLHASPGRLLNVATVLLALGLALFCADLTVRDLGAERLFPMAAPIGGTAMIVGWALIAISGLFARR